MIEDINLNYKNDISIENLAEEMDMSIPTFYRQFKSLTGFSPNQYIKNLRLSKAKELLM
ncbi:helix-turn-helix transcriptional regulator [bacterium]|nr:helix-turn-helix transcriptional regulator [bacterium]